MQKKAKVLMWFTVLITLIFSWNVALASLNGTYYFVGMQKNDGKNTGSIIDGNLKLYSDKTFELNSTVNFSGTYAKSNNNIYFYPKDKLYRSGNIVEDNQLMVFGAARQEEEVKDEINESYSVAVKKSSIDSAFNSTYYLHSWSFNSTNTTKNWVKEEKITLFDNGTLTHKTLCNSEDEANSTERSSSYNATEGIIETEGPDFAITESKNALIGKLKNNDINTLYVGVRDSSIDKIDGTIFSQEWQYDVYESGENTDRLDEKITHHLDLSTNDKTLTVEGKTIDVSEGSVEERMNATKFTAELPIDNGTIYMNRNSSTLLEGMRISPDKNFYVGFNAGDEGPETLRVGVLMNSTEDCISTPSESSNQTVSMVNYANTSENIPSSQEFNSEYNTDTTYTPISQKQLFNATLVDSNDAAVYRYQVRGISQDVSELKLLKLKSEETLEFEYDSDAVGNSGTWWLTVPPVHTVVDYGASLKKDNTYYVNFVVGDEGNFDVNSNVSSITDPNLLATESSDTTSDGDSTGGGSSGGGGGCVYSPAASSGWSWMLLLLIPAFTYVARRNRKMKA